MTVEVLHLVACADTRWCPAVLNVDGTLVAVGKVLADDVAAAVAPHIGPGEAAVVLDPGILDQIRRTPPGRHT